MQNEVQIHEVEIVFLHPLTRIYNASNLIDLIKMLMNLIMFPLCLLSKH